MTAPRADPPTGFGGTAKELAEAYRFARWITGTKKDAGTPGLPPPRRKVRRVVIDRPEALPSEFIRKLEEIINEDPRAAKIAIPGTRTITVPEE